MQEQAQILEPLPYDFPEEQFQNRRREIPLGRQNEFEAGETSGRRLESDSEYGDTTDELSSAKKRLNLYLSSTIHSRRVSKILSNRPMDFLDHKFRLERGKI